MHTLNEFPFAKAKGIRMLILDVDGVMTDGSIIMNDSGEESKGFNVRDGHGIKMLQRAGIHLAILTGRTSGVVASRARDLGIEYVVQGSLKKTEGLDTLLVQAGLRAEDCAFMGDDIVDLPPMRRCRLSFAPRDAHASVLKSVDWVATCDGGRGAVRLVAEGLILANGAWQQVVETPYGVTPADCGWPVSG
ncbi:MAG: phenylphosphate carboxylase subunit delta [Zetaproteobacteria bacterium CG2_30_59_37]|nr:MAG: phenylphosphate carboxylase subunit delta [Zetaproteobacteria bacterium CG2_30_59_37]